MQYKTDEKHIVKKAKNIIQIKANKKTVLFSEEFLLIVPTFQ